MEKFVKLAFVAGTGAVAGGALGAFSVERNLLKIQKDNVALQLDLQRAEYRNKDLVDQETRQSQHRADTYATSLARQWMRAQGMSEYEPEWRRAAIGPLVEKAIRARMLHTMCKYGVSFSIFVDAHNVVFCIGFSTAQVLQSQDVTHIAGADKLLRPGMWEITLEPVLKRVGDKNSFYEGPRFDQRQPDG
jgi:kynurenine formamidase